MLAIITARGNSKGLPGKNIRPLLGKPLIAYTVQAALDSKEVSEVIISTDDKAIADCAVNYGAKCSFMRPAYLASDQSQSIDTLIYTVDRLNKERNEIIENYIVLQPTSPLRTSYDIDSAISLFNDNNADSVVSYTEEEHPIYWHKHIDDNHQLHEIYNNDIMSRQNYKTSYFPNGSIYVFKHEIIKKHIYYTEKSYAYILPKERSVDIDTLFDFEYVEFLMIRESKRCKK